jgi:nitroreductase
MQTEETTNSRRAVKHFDSAHQMSNDEIKKILSLASRSPTAFNIQTWRFVEKNKRSLTPT